MLQFLLFCLVRNAFYVLFFAIYEIQEMCDRVVSEDIAPRNIKLKKYVMKLFMIVGKH